MRINSIIVCLLVVFGCGPDGNGQLPDASDLPDAAIDAIPTFDVVVEKTGIDAIPTFDVVVEKTGNGDGTVTTATCLPPSPTTTVPGWTCPIASGALAVLVYAVAPSSTAASAIIGPVTTRPGSRVALL